PVGMFVPWREGAVVQSTTKGLVYWEPDRTDPDAFLPDELAQLEPNQMMAGDELGLILGYWEPAASEPDSDRRIHLILGERELLLEGTSGAMRLTEDGEPVWREDADGDSVELNEAGALVFESGTGWRAEVPMEEWLSALSDQGAEAFWQGGIIHTVDGSEWSQTSWSEISGHDTMGLALAATDEFVVAADHTQVGRTPIATRVGFPLDGR
ncbi:MAG TPA: hypothetical protein VK088_08270, partial [Acidimicrobiia bacterium]|nr:hypothetical protein [Acidimicrobiia bacterium]